uniref:Pyr_redox_2 domain-containing protein n=3 Tax=Bursaphelenchus xylophilus TaxID=6326 RepID=A0A1I7SV43_BURXY
MKSISSRIVIVGGGIAGVSCLDGLQDSPDLPQNAKLIFICGKSGYIKRVKDYEKTGIVMEKFDVTTEPVASFSKDYEDVQVIEDNVISWNHNRKILHLSSNQQVEYDILVIATGAKPKSLNSMKSERILTIRDTDTVRNLTEKLKSAERVAIIGDGGIGMELA